MAVTEAKEEKNKTAAAMPHAIAGFSVSVFTVLGDRVWLGCSLT